MSSNSEAVQKMWLPNLLAPSSVIARSVATKQSREGYEIATHLSGARNDKSDCA